VFNEATGAPLRGTFLIDKEGTVIWSLVKVRDEQRTEMVPDSLEALHETV
jgi:peroxiredoxin